MFSGEKSKKQRMDKDVIEMLLVITKKFSKTYHTKVLKLNFFIFFILFQVDAFVFMSV